MFQMEIDNVHIEASLTRLMLSLEYWISLVNNISLDALASGITTTSAAIVLTL